MLNLITDRTARDVARLQELNAKGWENMTEAERTEWNKVSKGAYNYTDLNRVESAVSYLADLLNENGYPVEILGVRTSWKSADAPTLQDMTRYIENVRRIRNAFVVRPTTAKLPSTMSGLSYAAANAIEQTLQDVEVLLGNAISAYINCGEVFGGEW